MGKDEMTGDNMERGGPAWMRQYGTGRANMERDGVGWDKGDV